MRLGFMLPILFGLWVLVTFSGCSDMIRSLRQESAAIDREVDRDREDIEAGVKDYKPKTLRGVSANNVANYGTPSARMYGRKVAAEAAAAANVAAEEGEGYRRATRQDFVDKLPQENSLWDGQGQSNYLFSNNRRREPGDMITAQVEKDLRREIQYQLWLTLPPEQRKVKRAPASQAATDALKTAAGAVAKDGSSAVDKVAEKSQETKAKDAAEEAAKTNLATSGTPEDDVVRLEVVESLGNGLVRVLGQKRVVYKGVSRLIEVAALVNNKDIDDGNRMKSSNFLDMKAQVIQ
jgi:flagellar basal body L-ring protein FlgH